ncbi:hypothetical protein FK268_19925 [Tsukamurella sputi]|uniref:Uncharacterized protein n=1 Tax=Tsukamurella sputi TaxID=2591848 RepID=A0A5C5RHT6_9ACTN|nr:hypothetical protein [Tsukamurella sputi]TWS22278.1 hypothetical protein FK268_19925 [Tsukamurella sputi]
MNDNDEVTCRIESRPAREGKIEITFHRVDESTGIRSSLSGVFTRQQVSKIVHHLGRDLRVSSPLRHTVREAAGDATP